MTNEDKIARLQSRIENCRGQIAAANTMIANINSGVGEPSSAEEAARRGWRAMIDGREYEAVYEAGGTILFADIEGPVGHQPMSREARLRDFESSKALRSFAPPFYAWIAPTK